MKVVISNKQILLSVRKGPCGQGRLGTIPLKDKSKYNRRQKHKANWN